MLISVPDIYEKFNAATYARTYRNKMKIRIRTTLDIRYAFQTLFYVLKRIQGNLRQHWISK